MSKDYYELGRRQHERSRVTADVRRRVLIRDGHRCRFCGSNVDLQIDHINPISKGGTSDLSNLQVLCRTCNMMKGSRVLPGAIPHQPSVSSTGGTDWAGCVGKIFVIVIVAMVPIGIIDVVYDAIVDRSWVAPSPAVPTVEHLTEQQKKLQAIFDADPAHTAAQIRAMREQWGDFVKATTTRDCPRMMAIGNFSDEHYRDVNPYTDNMLWEAERCSLDGVRGHVLLLAVTKYQQHWEKDIGKLQTTPFDVGK